MEVMMVKRLLGLFLFFGISLSAVSHDDLIQRVKVMNPDASEQEYKKFYEDMKQSGITIEELFRHILKKKEKKALERFCSKCGINVQDFEKKCNEQIESNRKHREGIKTKVFFKHDNTLDLKRRRILERRINKACKDLFHELYVIVTISDNIGDFSAGCSLSDGKFELIVSSLWADMPEEQALAMLSHEMFHGIFADSLIQWVTFTNKWSTIWKSVGLRAVLLALVYGLECYYSSVSDVPLISLITYLGEVCSIDLVDQNEHLRFQEYRADWQAALQSPLYAKGLCDYFTFKRKKRDEVPKGESHPLYCKRIGWVKKIYNLQRIREQERRQKDEFILSCFSL